MDRAIRTSWGTLRKARRSEPVVRCTVWVKSWGRPPELRLHPASRLCSSNAPPHQPSHVEIAWWVYGWRLRRRTCSLDSPPVSPARLITASFESHSGTELCSNPQDKAVCTAERVGPWRLPALLPSVMVERTREPENHPKPAPATGRDPCLHHRALGCPRLS